MATLETLTALFVGKTVASVDLSRRAEYSATQIGSITFTDGTTIHFGGEHDCPFIDGLSINGEYQGSNVNLELDEPEEPEELEEEQSASAPEEPEPFLLRDVLPQWAIDLMENSKPRQMTTSTYKGWLDGVVVGEDTEWPVDRLEKRHIKKVWRFLDPQGGQTRAVGICEPSYQPGAQILMFASYAHQISSWIPNFGDDLDRFGGGTG